MNVQDLYIQKGNTYDNFFSITGAGGSPYDLTSGTISGYVKRQYSDTGTLAIFGINVTNAASGQFQVALSDAITEALPITIAFYDILFKINNSTTTIAKGNVYIEPDVTY